MKLKGIELKGTYKVKFVDLWFEVYDEKGKEIYVESSDGDWYKREYDEKGNNIYFENNHGDILDNRSKRKKKKEKKQ